MISYAGKDHGRLGNAREALGEEIRWEVVQVQVDVVLVRSAAAALHDLDGHGSGDNVA